MTSNSLFGKIMQQKVILALPLVFALASSGCTLNEGDPQTTLCQKLAENLSHNSQLNWDKATKTPLQDKSMQVEVHTSMDNSTTLKGVCIYLSDADDAGKDYDVNILDSYQNLPTSITVNGKEIPTRELHRAIQKVTGQSIEDTLKKLQ